MNRASFNSWVSDIEKLVSGLRQSELRSDLIGAGSETAVHRLQWKVDVPDPLLWLAAQKGLQKFYWRDRDGSRQAACVSAAVVLSSDEPGREASLLESARELADQKLSQVRLYGGFRFDSNYPESRRDARWDSFGSGRFLLPRFEMVEDHNGTRMNCYFLENEIGTASLDSVFSELEALRFENVDTDLKLPKMSERTDTPNRTEWNDQIERVLDLYGPRELKKLVLARRTSLRLNSPLNPWHTLYRLRESADNCYLYGVQTDDAAAFIGASPERLYRREGEIVKTEALAGTRPRAHDRKNDGELAKELAKSGKDREEHGIVVQGIREALAELSEKFESTESSETLKLAAVQHLLTSFSGKLRPGVGDSSILPRLHPSAAVGGYPREQALKHLHHLEPFDRGWYAGPIGWINESGAEFAVGIRSALVYGDRIDLWAGAGIVPGSIAGAEWDEIENKISPFLSLFEKDTR